jgi:hypothetical protein
MRIKRFRASVAAALAAGGLFFVTVAHAAPLDTNLVVDPSFENVDPLSDGPFTTLRLNQWQSDTDDNWAYPYAMGYSGPTVPPGSGEYHYSGGFAPVVGATYQEIDVSTGPSATAIATGLAKFDVNGYFSTYLQQNEFSSVDAVFLNASNTPLGSASAGGTEFGLTLPVVDGQVDWGFDSASGLIPIGTTKVRVQLSGGTSTNFDGYVDNVDFRISQVEGQVGDVNLDDVIDLDDFDIIRANFYEGTTREDGDLNFDGLVTETDFRIWKDAFGGGGPSSVPEPSSWVLLVGASFSAAALLRRRGR